MSYENRVLTNDQVALFERDGFIVLTDLLTPDEKQQALQWMDEIMSWPETRGKWFQYFEKVGGKKVLCRTENFYHYHPQLKDLISGKIADAISDCDQQPFCLYKEKINFKPPGGGSFPPHQDEPAYVLHGHTYHITCMIAGDPMTLENGCLEAVRGKHHEGVLRQADDGTIHPDVVSEMNWEPLICEAGDVLIFNSFVPHRSSVNDSNIYRRAYYLTFNRVSEGDRRDDYYRDKALQYPPEIDRVPGVDYSEGGKVYNLATPITNTKVEEEE